MLVTEEPVIQTVGCVNWPDRFPDKPEVELGICCNGPEILLNFSVWEEFTRAVCAHDKENIWEDSCVEFFFAPADDGLYYNFEFNSIGRMYLCCGRDRNDRVFLPEESYSMVRRRSSLGNKPFDIRNVGKWELEVVIPASALVFHDLHDFRGLHASGNFYKCGNMLPRRHYLSWAPVVTPSPDFHRPEFFGQLDFDM